MVDFQPRVPTAMESAIFVVYAAQRGMMPEQKKNLISIR